MNRQQQYSFTDLHEAILADNEELVQDIMFGFTSISLGLSQTPDEVVEFVLRTLDERGVNSSKVAGHLLNYFEFEFNSLSFSQKTRLMQYLKEKGDKFTHYHAVQVVTELLGGDYLGADQ